MPSDQDLHLSPITGTMIRPPQAAEAAPAKKPSSTSDWKSTHAWPPPPPYSPFISQPYSPFISQPYSPFIPQPHSPFTPQPQIAGPVNQHFRDCTSNINIGQSSKRSHHYTHEPSSHPHPKPQQHAPSHPSKTTIPETASPAIEPHHQTHQPHPSKIAKRVHFTSSVSIHERAPKRWDPAGEHATNHRSKSGLRPPAPKVERLTCESCQVRSQGWWVDGRMLCEGCLRFREGKRAGRR